MSPQLEREREILSTLPDNDAITRRRKDGWRLVAVEWEREASPVNSSFQDGPPFGLQIDAEKNTLEAEPTEWETLVLMMELTVSEGPYWSIAEELNRRGYRTRGGKLWTPVSVFRMLPRLIEVGPRIFASAEWQARRSRLSEPGGA